MGNIPVWELILLLETHTALVAISIEVNRAARARRVLAGLLPTVPWEGSHGACLSLA